MSSNNSNVVFTGIVEIPWKSFEKMIWNWTKYPQKQTEQNTNVSILKLHTLWLDKFWIWLQNEVKTNPEASLNHNTLVMCDSVLAIIWILLHFINVPLDGVICEECFLWQELHAVVACIPSSKHPVYPSILWWNLEKRINKKGKKEKQWN